MMLEDPFVTIEDLVISYPTDAGEIKALDGVSLRIIKGEVLGVIGESGSGKSTLGLSMLSLVPYPGRIAAGKIKIGATEVGSLSGEALRRFRWRKVAMVFQSAMNALDPVQTVGAQLVETIRQHTDLDKRGALTRAAELLSSVGLDPALVLAYPHELSGGMRQRVIIALSLCVGPELLIADEPSTGLDVVAQAGVLRMLRALREKLGLTLVLISHDLSIMGAMCDRIAVIYAGKIVEVGPSSEVISRPKHPYTEALLNSILEVGRVNERAVRIRGTPPNMLSPPAGCRFHPRCSYTFGKCELTEPRLARSGGREVACWLSEDR
jgi:peptide/nickel transport system ATP-binding protein